MNRLRKEFLCATAFVALSLIPGAAMAEDGAAAVDNDAEITVTARRKEESIVDVPLAISVVTSEKLAALDIRDTSTLANFVPGLEFNNYSPGYARNDRGAYRTLSFRGLAIGGAASLFLDGAAVSGNEIPASMDIGAVEVLRGPQSVYFGRSTMTGAVSYRTKAIPDRFSGTFEVQYAQRDSIVAQASLAGPIIPDILKARVTGLYERSNGYINNDYDNSTLGDRSRKSISGTFEFTPASGLDFKAYVNYFRDLDGASATTFIPSKFANCRLPGATRPVFCGEIPNRSLSINYFNTSIPTNVSDFIFGIPLTDGSGFKDRTGGQRAAFNSHLVGNYEISDYLKLQSITGYHTSVSQAVADGTAQPANATTLYAAYYYNLVQKSRDFSQELRLNSDPERRLSWTLGGNYLFVESKGGVRTGFVSKTNGALTSFSQGIGTTVTKTLGAFGGLYFKATDALTISAEARYQADERETTQLNAANVQTFNASKTFKAFTPRVSLDYDVGGGKKVYASYAKGTRPGGFNSNIFVYASQPTVLAEINDKLGATSPFVEEEKLQIGELGFKGAFDGGKGYFDLNAYYGKLKNQQVTFSALILSLGASVTATRNAGATEIYGVEWSGSYNFTPDLSLSTTFAWNHSKRTEFNNAGGLADFGTVDFSGKKFSNVPEISGSAVLSYSTPISDDWKLFVTDSLIYRGKMYVDAFNAAYIPGRFQADGRIGVSNDNYTIELFMRNIFNDRSYTNGSVAPDFGSTGVATYNSFFGAVAEPRQIGARIRANF